MPLAGHDTGGLLSAPIVEGNFNPRTLGGRDAGGLLSAPIVEDNFNPRAPCGARPAALIALIPCFPISIPVPLAGHDLILLMA